MTPSEIGLLRIALFVLGSTLVFSGWRKIKKRRTHADGREYEGKAAARLGWLWVILGILLFLAAAFDVPILRTFGRLFLESNS